MLGSALVIRFSIGGGLAEHVHELDGRALHAVHQAGDAGRQEVVAEVGEDTDDQTADRGDHGGVDAAGQKGDVDVVAGVGHVEERLHHTDHGAEEADHRGAAGDGGEVGEALLEAGHLDVADILDGGLHVGGGLADAGDAGLDHPGDGRVVLAAERPGGLDLPFVDVVADVVDEILVNLAGLADDPPFLAEDVDGDHRQGEEHPHEPAAFRGHLEEGIRHLLLHGSSLGDDGQEKRKQHISDSFVNQQLQKICPFGHNRTKVRYFLDLCKVR